MKRINTFFMKTGWITIVLIVFTIGLSSAQTDSSYTLQQCIDYALKNNVNVQNAEFDEFIAKAQIGEFRGLGLPQINGSATIIDNPKLQRMFLNNDPNTPGFSSGFFPVGTPAGTYAIPNMFQLRSSGDAKITASQLIFSGSYLIGLKAAKTVAELSVKNTNLSKIQVVENVTKAYYSVLLNQERKKVLDANITRIEVLYKETKAMHEQGFIEKIDVDRLEVSYNNLTNERVKFEQIIELTILVLKYQMVYEAAKPLKLQGDLRELTSVSIVPKANTDSTAYSKRPEYELLKTQYKLEGLNLKNKYMESVPSLSAFGNYGLNRSGTNIGSLFESRKDPIFLNGKDISATWFNYSNWGVSLNVPIFSGFSQKYKIQQSKLNLKKIQNNMDYFKEVSYVQTKQAEINIKNSLVTMESNKRNYELATEIAKVSKVKYQEGVGSNLEVVTAEASLKEAQSNYFNSMYDLIIADIDYKIATGSLNQK